MTDPYRPDDSSGASGDGPEDPWTSSAHSEPLRKRPESAANEPTVTAMPEAGPVGGPSGPQVGRPAPGGPAVVGPPPPAPPASHPPPAASAAYPGAGPTGTGPGAYGTPAGYGAQYGGYPPPSGPYGPVAPPVYGYGPPGGYVRLLPRGQSTAAMVLGIVSMVLIITGYGAFLALVTSPIALGLGLSARRKVERGELDGHGPATAGLVMGIIGVVISVIIVVLLLLAVGAFIGSSEDDGDYDDPGYSDTYDAGTAWRLAR